MKIAADAVSPSLSSSPLLVSCCSSSPCVFLFLLPPLVSVLPFSPPSSSSSYPSPLLCLPPSENCLGFSAVLSSSSTLSATPPLHSLSFLLCCLLLSSPPLQRAQLFAFFFQSLVVYGFMFLRCKRTCTCDTVLICLEQISTIFFGNHCAHDGEVRVRPFENSTH